MDISLLVFFAASMVFVYALAQERGRRPGRWVLVASLIGPFAIPALYLAVATSAFRKMIDVPRP